MTAIAWIQVLLSTLVLDSYRPSHESSCIGWYDVSQLTDVADATDVTTWADACTTDGADDFTQSTAAAKPHYTNSMINGHSSLSFDGVDDVLTTSDDDDWSYTDGAGNDKSFIVFTVVQMNDTNPLRIVKGNVVREYILGTSGGKLYSLLYNGLGSGVYIARRGPNLAAGAYNVLTFDYDGSESADGIDIWQNGTIVDDTTFTGGTYVGVTNSTEIPRLGELPGDFTYMDIAEVIYLIDDRTTAQIARVQRYLHSKYGISGG